MNRPITLRQVGGSVGATLPKDMADRLHLAVGDGAACRCGGVAPRSALAAAYAFGLARNHPFNDGSKRIAFLVAVVFLGLKGLGLRGGGRPRVAA